MLQVKNLPDDLHAVLAERARREGVSMSEYVTRLIRRDLARPTLADWLDERRSDDAPVRRIDVVHTLDEVRVEYDPDERHAPSTSRDDRATTGR